MGGALPYVRNVKFKRQSRPQSLCYSCPVERENEDTWEEALELGIFIGH